MLVTKILHYQTWIACWVSGAVAMGAGLQVGVSSLLGAMTWLAPNLMFCRYFLGDSQRTAKAVVGTFYKGVFLKIVSIILLFACLLQSSSLHSASFFSMFCGMQLLFWVLSFKFLEQNRA